MQFEIGTSISRKSPANGTAGSALTSVSGRSSLPGPPPNIMTTACDECDIGGRAAARPPALALAPAPPAAWPLLWLLAALAARAGGAGACGVGGCCCGGGCCCFWGGGGEAARLLFVLLAKVGCVGGGERYA